MPEPVLSEELKNKLKKQHYYLAGKHSGVKICTWLKKSLRDKGFCYKQQFYGIHSHLCLQCTPVINWCTQNCLFCWRVGNFEKSVEGLDFEDPKEIVDEMILGQRKLINGFPGFAKTNMTKFKEAQNPKHAAISLTGEPTLYPKLNELLKEFHKRGMTTFLVTNGTQPEALKKLKEMPTQLYVSLCAPNKETYLKTCIPQIKDGWENLMETLKFIKNMNTRKVLRLTLVKDLNMHSPEKYAKLALDSGVHFIEPKAYMSIGGSTERLNYNQMPTHKEIRDFSEKIAKAMGWKIIDEKEDSRVCLIAKEDYPWRIMKF